ncbi:putative acetyl-CoA acyltransferase [Pseudovibrio axinellae]|uniref:Putative acetyl-CoA acyltransferase n=1 Tax=Pseudovibrio axinellae TaxID=989403 RepID=A0A166A3I3_9HYPH|nr:thiolase family protein [Pseudovibrio axinellae]KZL20590.1 putative acetyl-CoA acyltransferase [Pseudovibrio axinellae]SER28459.1 acetyl-CoA C-acetyltransferase [Pseudovibrio axinellae]
MSVSAYLVAARRTSVEPRGGVHADRGVHELWAPVATAVLADAGLSLSDVDEVVLGNGLYGGGNPARVAALECGLPLSVTALTLDTQCCSGLDSLVNAAASVGSGQAEVVLCGGLESYSKRPLRAHKGQDGQADFYLRPPFTPWPECDPDMLEAAAHLARTLRISNSQQNAWAIESHQKTLRALGPQEFVLLEGQTNAMDGFARKLSPRLAQRAKLLTGEGEYVQTSATTAVEADAAAALLVVSGEVLDRLNADFAVEIIGCSRKGADPEFPGLAPIASTQQVLAKTKLSAQDFAAVEIMEAFASQAIACADAFEFDPLAINRGGGALARGHPIGASGAILAVRLFHELKQEPNGALGLAMIAAAGGLGTSAVLQRCV